MIWYFGIVALAMVAKWLRGGCVMVASSALNAEVLNTKCLFSHILCNGREAFLLLVLL